MTKEQVDIQRAIVSMRFSIAQCMKEIEDIYIVPDSLLSDSDKYLIQVYLQEIDLLEVQIAKSVKYLEKGKK